MKANLGAVYEQMAAEFLASRGFEIIERNFHSRFGEIDIVAKKDSVLHFIEVKGSQSRYRADAISPSKLSKILKTIEFYLYVNDLEVAYCVDAIVIVDQQVEFLENVLL
ncbi:hypothetical protein BBW65_04370 [Helicobacter enhydrae]|uniref:UPF0102 protein BBW65_04370 n=1 Tax=Helicobacter enhydrae TaxID=222136 RepID=A0A1B1U5Q3_9HELI|nr:YraN family protein [Helicobacter enhydrae]ANV98080.1 hypothetical protein BBW65_04370 [Helicobacter enhydrae]